MKRKILSVVAVAVLTTVVLASCKKETKASEEISTEQVVTTTEEENVVIDQSNAKTSLNWPGTYKGTIPSADGEGIDETINLNEDGTFKLVQHFIGKKDGHYEEEGTFEWDASGNSVILTSKSGEKIQAKIQEGSLLLLDQEGNIIKGKLADNYRLTKQ